MEGCWARIWRPCWSHLRLMALDSNAMKDKLGKSLPHFTTCQTPASSGVNLFAQDLSRHEPFLERPYVFPPSLLVGPVLCFLKSFRRSCLVLVLDVYPRKYRWPLIQCWSTRSLKLACQGDSQALLITSKTGWINHSNIPGDLDLLGWVLNYLTCV